MSRDLILKFFILTFIYSCSQSPQKIEINEEEIKVDSEKVSMNSDKEKYFSVERGINYSKACSIQVKSTYQMPDKLNHDSSYYCTGNYLYVLNNVGTPIDSIRLAEMCEYGIIIQNVTNQLHFKTPIFEIATPSGSDYYTCEFIEFNADSLRKLFEIPEAGKPASLYWKDKNTLTGFIQGRDEIVGEFQDYPVKVSLDNYEVTYETPSKQHIGYKTEVLEDFSGYRFTSNNEKTNFILKKGTTILIDSLNRLTNIVRIIVNDTIVIYVPISNIKNKIQINAAG